MDVDDMLKKAKKIVMDYYFDEDEEEMVERSITEEEVYIVWFCKTLQNWKALVSTIAEDGTYYEITYNGDKKETYLDVYTKKENLLIPDREE